jgi:protein TonB
MAGQQSRESGTHRIGGGVSAPVLIHKEEPQYSAQARAANYEGKAVLYVEIGPDGIVRKVRILQGVGFGLNEKAMEAVSQWRFKPGRKSGEPVTVAATIEVNWRLL